MVRSALADLREVNISDLLRRKATQTEDEKVGSILGGRAVLVTGAGGSIGSELCRQIARWGPSELILVGHGGKQYFETILELKESFPALLVRPLI